MGEWARLFQNEEFLEKTRMAMLHPDMAPVIAKWIGLSPGMKVLDVGCGTGAFSRYLAGAVQGIRITGLDCEEAFISYAKKQPLPARSQCDFLTGDALSLPFEDGTFDAVVSHTFLTSLPDYRGGLCEMKRVCRPGGIVAAVTPATISNTLTRAGTYPPEFRWKKRFDELNEKVWTMYQAIAPFQAFSQGAAPEEVPHLFGEFGLKEIRVYPVGVFFSQSNAALREEDRKRYIELDCLSEEKRVREVFGEPGADEYLTKPELTEYLDLLKERKASYLADLEENSIWEWFGNLNLLTVGAKISNKGEQENV